MLFEEVLRSVHVNCSGTQPTLFLTPIVCRILVQISLCRQPKAKCSANSEMLFTYDVIFTFDNKCYFWLGCCNPIRPLFDNCYCSYCPIQYYWFQVFHDVDINFFFDTWPLRCITSQNGKSLENPIANLLMKVNLLTFRNLCYMKGPAITWLSLI